MARVVEQYLKKPLADAILFGALKDGGTAKVGRKGDGLTILTKAR
jgi:ATP-dependent Clp protease ATP-binding subunit ClpA